MKKAVLACCILVAGHMAFSQEEKVISDNNAEKRTVTTFHAINIEDGIDLFVIQGQEEAVAVSALYVKDRDRIKTEVKNGVLRIYIPNEFNLSFRERRLKAYVSVKDIDGIQASGGSDVYAREGLKSDAFKLSLSGGSDFRGKITTTKLNVGMSGSSDVYISGSASELHISASGSSDFNGYDLPADYITISASGSSDAKLTVNKELVADASGSSDIDYRGSGVVRKVSSSGSSSINKRG